jgi:hypothetical protein
MDEPVNVLFAADRLAIDGNPLARFNSRAKIVYDLAVDADAAGGD